MTLIKKISFAVLFITIGLSSLDYSSHKGHSFTSGSPGTSTGSPGDQNQTCRSCHGPGSAAPKTNLITTNIPVGGYIPGVTYDVVMTFSEPGRSKFGFEMTSENSSKVKKGKFISPNGQYKTLGGSSANRITHTGSGTSAPGGNKTWNFQWIAPSAGSGDITFYAAINASNSNGNDDSGDNIYITNLAVKEDITSSIADYISKLSPDITIFPNPVHDLLAVNFSGSNNDVQFEIRDLSGVLVSVGTTLEPTNVSQLSKGVYLLSTTGKVNITKRFIKQ